MFKKHYDYILAIMISIVLTSALYLYLAKINAEDTGKSKLQLTVENVSHRWNDLFYSEYSTKKPSQDVVLLAIDEASINEIGRWPWSRTIVNQITQELFKYKIKTLTFDIIFSEKESAIADNAFAKTISKYTNQITLGTYSNFKTAALPYQDYCLTEAFKYTGGLSLVKINPFFSVDDDSIAYEEIPFDRALVPVFQVINKVSEEYYLEMYNAKTTDQLSQYQQNALYFYKKQNVYDYCTKWLTNQDPYDYSSQKELTLIYQGLFQAQDENDLKNKISDFKSSVKQNPIPQYNKWRQNIESLQEASTYTASFLADTDNDGIVRNYPLVYRTGNKIGTSYIPSPAIQAYLAATGHQAVFKLKTNKKTKVVSSIEIHDPNKDNDTLVTTLPADSEGKMLINYYGKQAMIPYVPAKELINNSKTLQYEIREPAENGQFIIKTVTANKANFLQDKNVIVGATAIGIYDIRTTPLDINYPGPEIHATALSNILSNQFLTYDRHETERASLIFFVMILVCSVLFIKFGIRNSSLLYITVAALLILIQKSNYEQGVVFQSSFLFFTLLFFAYFTAVIYKYFFQSKKSKEIRMAFSKYVSKDVVNEILKNEGAIELRGQKLHMSVYFSDIRGFTSFSEKMDPVELSELLNKYFTPMSAIITKHRGTIDKYIGDAIMAMFGAPINYKNHAQKACEAALECTEALKILNSEFAKRNWPEIKIGIGINTGYMNAGNIGSETIQNYTVIGDSVNLASRIESLTKEYGVSIIISEYTYNEVREFFVCKELDQVRVKGKEQPIRIYELISKIKNDIS